MHEPLERSIIHLDLDSFYAAVEVLDNPELKGQPVIVGGLGRRSVVSTASYEARAKGLHSGMPMAQARQLCPEGIYIQVRMERYQELSAKVMEIFHRYTPLVEPLSLDEAFLDVSGSLELFGEAKLIAKRIKDEVKSETGLVISAGVSTSKHIAKIASGINKPDALVVVEPGKELDFLQPLDLKYLWGAGKVTLSKMRNLGLVTIGDFAKLDPSFVVSRFGENGRHLWELSNGIDKREVESVREAKSLGAEETYEYDIYGEDIVARELLALSVKLSRRLRDAGLIGLTLTLKLRDPDFKTTSRSKTVERPLGEYLPIYALALELLSNRKGPFRLMGLSVSKLASPQDEQKALPKGLFPDLETDLPAGNPKLARAMDLIRERFGKDGIIPATLLERSKRSPKDGEK